MSATKKPKVRFTYTRPQRVSARERDALWAIYSTHFETERERLETAIDRATEVLRFYDRGSGELIGMTLVSAWDAEHQGRRVRMVSTGAVCVRPEYRGLNAIQAAGLWWLARERVRKPLRELWWYYDTFSFKTYLILPRNLVAFWPRRDRATPDWEQGLISQCARYQSGEAWDESAGVIRSQGRKLRPGIADVPRDNPDEDLEFFLERNPGFAQGERIPCLIPLTAGNVASIVGTALRRVRNGKSQRHPGGSRPEAAP